MRGTLTHTETFFRAVENHVEKRASLYVRGWNKRLLAAPQGRFVVRCKPKLDSNLRRFPGWCGRRAHHPATFYAAFQLRNLFCTNLQQEN